MNVRLPFRNLIPTFFAGLLDDPILLLRTRPDGHHVMFDCGQIHHLAKRTFTHLEAIFISHAHMDHWMGIDSVVRQLIAAGKTVSIYGGPGLAEKFDHKLKGYDWNLAEDYWSSFRVFEVHSDRLSCDLFSGAESFQRKRLADLPRENCLIYENDYLKVSAASCDHRVDSLIYRIDERPAYRIDLDRLEQLQLLPGPWLGQLKQGFTAGGNFPERLSVQRSRGGQIETVDIDHPCELGALLMKPGKTHACGYISDVGFSPQNRVKIVELMSGVDLLVCECTFLSEAKTRARASWHLCSDDVNALLAELRPRYFLPMHLSRSYSRRAHELYRELQCPEDTKLLELPLQLTPRPLIADEVSWQLFAQ